MNYDTMTNAQLQEEAENIGTRLRLGYAKSEKSMSEDIMDLREIFEIIWRNDMKIDEFEFASVEVSEIKDLSEVGQQYRNCLAEDSTGHIDGMSDFDIGKMLVIDNTDPAYSGNFTIMQVEIERLKSYNGNPVIVSW